MDGAGAGLAAGERGVNAVVQQATFAEWLVRSMPRSRTSARLKIAGLDPARVAIHRNTFVVTLVDVLADAFPVTQALAGRDFFRRMAQQRVLTDPPDSPVVAEYASGLPHFVSDYPPAAAVPLLASVARLEGLCLRAYHAADATPVEAQSFHALLADPERLARTGLRLHPAARWMQSRHAIHSVWSAHQGLPELSAVDLGGIDPRRSEAVLVARPGLDVVVALLPPGAFMFLDSLSSGLSLQSAISDAQHEARSVDIASLFSLLLRYGLAIELIDTRQESP